MKLTVLTLGLLNGAVQLTSGMMANPETVLITVKGGCQQKVKSVGNAFASWLKREDEYSICQNGDDFYYVDAMGACAGPMVTCPGPNDVSKYGSIPNGIVPNLKMVPKVSEEEQNIGDDESFVAKLSKNGRRLAAPARLNNLVLQIRFKDHDESLYQPQSDYDFLFNGEGTKADAAPTGSVRAFYLNNSLGALDINNVLSGWIEVPYTERQAAGSSSGCHGTCSGARLKDAIKSALRVFDARYSRAEFRELFDMDGDGTVDMFTVMHSGRGAEAVGGKNESQYWIWSHKWTLGGWGGFTAPVSGVRFNNYNVNPGLWHVRGQPLTYDISRFAVMAHEMGHFLGLPDLYDTDYSSSGLGTYCMMANSWGLDRSQLRPPSFSPRMKEVLGWLDVEEVNTASKLVLPPVQLTNKVFKLTFSSRDYVFIENRQPIGSDINMAGGIVMYHVDSSRSSQNSELNPLSSGSWRNTHPYIRVMQQDLLFQLEKDRTVDGNSGDAGDFWTNPTQEISDKRLEMDPIMPNLNSYSSLGSPSGKSLYDFQYESSPKGYMSFKYNDGTKPTTPPSGSPPTKSPVAKPTKSPVAKPTKSPVKTPTKSPTPPTKTPTRKPTAAPTEDDGCWWWCNSAAQSEGGDVEIYDEQTSHGPFVVAGAAGLVGIAGIFAAVKVMKNRKNKQVENAVAIGDVSNVDEML